MNTYILLAIVGGLPLLLVLILRLSAIHFFISVASGILLSQYTSSDTLFALDAFFSHQNLDSIIRLGLLLLPVLLTLFFLRKTLATSKLVLHFLPIVVTSAALSTFIVEALPGGIKHQILTDKIGQFADNAQTGLIAASVILTLILIWLTKRHSPEKKHRRH